MCPTVFLPSADIRHKQTGAHNILETGTGLLQNTCNLLYDKTGLRISIICPYQFIMLIDGNRSGNLNGIANLYGPAISDNIFPGSS